MLEWRAAHDIATVATHSLPGVERQFLDRDGRVLQRFPDATPFTSWDAVFHQLRAAFPDDRYHHGRQCVGVSASGVSATVEFPGGDRVEERSRFSATPRAW